MSEITLKHFVQVDLQFFCWKDKEGTDSYISYCPELQIASCGDSQNDAYDMMMDAIRLFMISCYKQGNLTQTLNDCFSKSDEEKHSIIPPEILAGNKAKNQEKFDIPLEPERVFA